MAQQFLGVLTRAPRFHAPNSSREMPSWRPAAVAAVRNNKEFMELNEQTSEYRSEVVS